MSNDDRFHQYEKARLLTDSIGGIGNRRAILKKYESTGML